MLQNIGFRGKKEPKNNFVTKILQAQATKTNIGKRDCLKKKSFYIAKKVLHRKGENIFNSLIQ